MRGAEHPLRGDFRGPLEVGFHPLQNVPPKHFWADPRELGPSSEQSSSCASSRRAQVGREGEVERREGRCLSSDTTCAAGSEMAGTLMWRVTCALVLLLCMVSSTADGKKSCTSILNIAQVTMGLCA